MSNSSFARKIHVGIQQRKKASENVKSSKRQRRSRSKKPREVLCTHCHEPAKLVKGDVVYPHRKDLHEKYFYFCKTCDAWVGCHPGTTRALGKPATAETRRARMYTHKIFDPIWQKGRMKRPAAYSWLSQKLGIKTKKCHIGQFDIETCRLAYRVCKVYWAENPI